MYQQLILIGNVGRDPEMRTSQNGRNFTTFSLATTRKWKSNDGTLQSETTWFNITCWGSYAEVAAKYVKKGSRLFIIGRLRADQQTGSPRVYARNDGSYGARFDVDVTTLQLLDSKNQNQDSMSQNNFYAPPSVNQQPASFEDNMPVFPENDDDIPF